MRKILSHIILVVLISFGQNVLAQSNAQKQGDKHYDDFNYSLATEFYEKALKRDPGNYLIQQRIGDCYLMTNQPEKAIEWYTPLVDLPNAEADLIFNYAQAKRSTGLYNEASIYYDKFAEMAPEDPRANMFDDFYAEVLVLREPDPNTEVYAIETLNTPYMEFGPALIGDNMVFTSNRPVSGPVSRKDNRTGEGFNRMYAAFHEGNGMFGTPQEVIHGKPLPKLHEGPATFSEDGLFMYFTKVHEGGTSRRGMDGALHLSIFEAKFFQTEGKWVDLQRLSFNTNDYSCAHPSLSADGETLFFMSDQEGGFGGNDLYVSYKSGDTWGAPINLGPGVNTPGNESFPYIAPSGHLYFASDSRNGLGGLDIYRASFTNGQWGAAKNLGAPINSEYDDFSFAMAKDGNSGFFASNRFGNDDLFRYTVTKVVGPHVDVVVMDGEGKVILPGSVVALKDMYTGEVVRNEIANEKGMVRFTLPPMKPFMITASFDGFPTTSTTVNLSSNETRKISVIKMGNTDLMNLEGAFVFEVKVKDQSGQLPLVGASIDVENKKTGEFFTGITDTAGVALFTVDGNTDYNISATFKDSKTNAVFFSQTEEETTKGRKPPAYIYVHLTMDKMVENAITQLSGIEYAKGSSELSDEAKGKLDNVIENMKVNPGMVIELRSHSDCTKEGVNPEQLSLDRNKAAFDYMVSNGINKSRIMTIGLGDRYPEFECEPCSSCTEDDHRKNRSTNFRVVKMR